MGRPLPVKALRILREVPGLDLAESPADAKAGSRATLLFSGRRATVTLAFLRSVNGATASLLGRQGRRPRDPPLLVVAEVATVEARRILGDHGIGLVEARGYAHLELPGLLLHREVDRVGEGVARVLRRCAGDPPPTKFAGRAGRAALVLLLHPDRAWGVQPMAKEAGISVGLAHRVLARLEREGVLLAEGRGPRRVRTLIGPGALLDLWAEEQTERPLRTRGFLLARTSGELMERVAANLARARMDHAFTGAGGASLLAPFVTSVPVLEVRAPAAPAAGALCEAAGVEPVEDGHNVVLLQGTDDTALAFAETVGGIRVANRFRLYADLLADPRRGREQADHFRREVIGW